MKLLIRLLAFTLATSPSLHGQDILWKAGLHSFFDNTEFGGSPVQVPQTMAGVHVTPEIGFGIDGRHSVYAGVDLLHEYGSEEAVGTYTPIAYYEYAGRPLRFYAGSIPRRLVLDRYPRIFFRDSVANYRPAMNGVFWEYAAGRKYANVWLDWTGLQGRTQREAFFVGWSGRYEYKQFYAQHFGYVFHYAKSKNPAPDEFIHDNILTLTSAGVDLSQASGFVRLEANIGWTLGLERDRGAGVWHSPQGLHTEVAAEYKGVGLFNTYYKGNPQQLYYGDHGGDLYWGDAFYRSPDYDRADFYIYFIHTPAVKLKFIYSMHFSGRKMYHEQAFYATFDLNNLKTRRTAEDYHYFWENWF
ncbi:MAG: hypothetical protein LBJ58_06965 [Tannerellaceae bacterium]|jgi:hypothetical protein|nr:hypothetical protein [Tannerellaceae bacterium]